MVHVSLIDSFLLDLDLLYALPCHEQMCILLCLLFISYEEFPASSVVNAVTTGNLPANIIHISMAIWLQCVYIEFFPFLRQ